MDIQFTRLLKRQIYYIISVINNMEDMAYLKIEQW